MSPWTWVVVVVAVLILLPVLRALVLVAAAPWIRSRALSRLPDAIRLVPDAVEAWRNDPNWSRTLGELEALGYAHAGAFTVAELPGVVVQLLVHPAECVLATCYEHPVAGRWTALVAEYADGTCTSATNGRAPEEPHRAGCEAVHAPGADAAAMHARLVAARPRESRVPVTGADAVPRFEQRWAAEVAWRKSRSRSVREARPAESRQVA